MSDSTLNLLWSNLKIFNHNIKLTNLNFNYKGITNGLLPLGGLFGGFSSGFVADLCGRLPI